MGKIHIFISVGFDKYVSVADIDHAKAVMWLYGPQSRTYALRVYVSEHGYWSYRLWLQWGHDSIIEDNSRHWTTAGESLRLQLLDALERGGEEGND